MNEFKLVPFATQDILPEIEIIGRIDRQNELISIEYELNGDLNTIASYSPSALPSRQFELWSATCFEFFIGIPGTSAYWEFNLSPTGDWNVFHLDDYRQGLQNELAFIALPFTIDRQANRILLKLIFDIHKIINGLPEVEISITAVIKSHRNALSYWALTHTGTEADFHRRDSFILKL